jgi:kynureninase
MPRAELAAARTRALALDAADPLAAQRERFRLPTTPSGAPAIYLAGQSLGAQPVAAQAAVEAELEAWARFGVEGWFRSRDGWLDADGSVRDATARLVGARPAEVATLNTLTVNLHLLLAAFFRPAGRRSAILIDAPTFPSDRYAVESQLRLHGLDPSTELIVVRPSAGASLLSTDELEAAIHADRDRLAVVLLAGVNYATGQARDVGRLTAAAHRAGALAAWDLAHSVGNVPLALHDADVDLAVWCTYKYLNSGPGALGQVFIHERHATDPRRPRLAGWWGNDAASRFRMDEGFDPGPGADGWRVSTPPILSLAPIRASLAMFDDVGIAALREKSVALTGYLEWLLETFAPEVEILTPHDPDERGAQLSIRLPAAPAMLAALEARGVIADFREPDIIRLAPVPFYNTFLDAWAAVEALAAVAGD